jgi:hypothetical protein
MTLLYGNLLDTYIHTEDGSENILIRTRQLAEQIDDLVMNELFKNLGNLLDICSNKERGIDDILIKAKHLSQKYITKE